MEKLLVARGQATILAQKDAYTISQSVGDYIFTANNNGTIPQAVSFSSIIKVALGDDNLTNFTIGTVTKPAGFSAITVNNTNKTVAFSVAANTSNMADSGLVNIPVIIAGQTYTITFSYAKAKAGISGVDSNILDWVKDWNNGKTVIGSESVITPKIFAGTKNSNDTVTGIAIGRFSLKTVNASGAVVMETINGIYGFKDGYKTFAIDSAGSVLMGKGNQFIRYNPANGKIEFGSEVTLNWTNAINTAKTEAVNTAATTAQTKADAAKNAAISTAATDATNKVNAIKIGGRNYIRNSAFTAILTGVSSEGTTVSIDTATLYSNYRTLKVIQNTACTDPNAASQRTYFNAINGKVCTPASFSMYVKGSVASVMKIRIGGTGIRTVNVTTAWQRITLENITPTSAVVLFGFQTVGTYWCALPMLVEGSKAADWAPAPEDVDSSVSDAKKAGTDAKAVADAITNKANTEGWATKLTYIGSTGIFTGTLSANTVNAVRINATQITAGTIDAARINVAALKTSLITAGNIEALTLNVVRGKIGGWSIDADSIFRGTKNNTSAAYTAASGTVTIGSNGIRGFKWRLDATGAGAVAGGNISWDAAGNVTFGSSVVLNWTTPITNITNALGGSSFPKLTKISSTGIYTGTLTAAQVNAVAINASSITAGTLSADRIGAKAITAAKIAAGTITAVEINVASIQASVVTATAVNGLTCTFNKGKIAGWNINASQVYKNNVYLGSDGSIYNGTKWKLNNDGSGQIANGNIAWNATGIVTFGASVSLNWTNAIENIQIGGNNLLNNSGNWKAAGWNGGYTTNGGGYTIDSSVTFNGKPTVKSDVGAGLVHSAWLKLETNVEYTYSAMVRCNKTVTGHGSAPLHYWAGKDNTSQSKISVLKYDTSVVADTWKRIYVVFKLTSDADSFRAFLYRGSNESTFYNVAYFKLEKGNKPTDWSQSDSDANKLSTDAQNSANSITTALGGSNYPKLTKISSTGIYTGTLTAAQVNAVAINASSITAGTLSADRIAAGSIKADKLDATTIKSSIINTTYINGLTCTFVRGTIGGWTINSTQVFKNNVYLGSDGSISNGTKWKLNNDGSGQIASGNIIWNAAGVVTFASSVSLNWTNAATNALNSAKSYADTKKTEAVNAAATDATTKADAAKELATAMAFGKMLYRDPTFEKGSNYIGVYNKSENGTVTLNWLSDNSAPNDSKKVLEITTTGTASPGCGGFYFATQCSNRKIFITRFIAKIPVGRKVQWYPNSIGTGGSSKWLTSNAGTGDWAEYIFKVTCGTANFSATNYFYIEGSGNLAWYLAYATVFDVTSTEKYTTTINSSGIYTGTIRANQVVIDSALVVGGSSYNGSISVRDAANSEMVTLDRKGIKALAGEIGGWHIKSGAIYASSPAGGHRVYITSSGYLYNDDGTQDYWGLRSDGAATFGYGKIFFDRDGSGYVADKNIKWDTKGNVEVKGNITANSGLIAGFTIKGNKLINTAADSSIEFSSMMGNASMTINSYSSLLSLRADSARTGISIQTYATGAVGLSIIANAGSNFAIEAYGPVQFGQRAGERWCAPGVLYIGCKYNSGNNSNFSKIWGEGCNITSCYHQGNAQYKFYHNLGHTNYTVFAQGCQSTGYYGFFRLLERASSYFIIQNIGSNGGPDGSPFDFVVYGRNKWY